MAHLKYGIRVSMGRISPKFVLDRLDQLLRTWDHTRPFTKLLYRSSHLIICTITRSEFESEFIASRGCGIGELSRYGGSDC